MHALNTHIHITHTYAHTLYTHTLTHTTHTHIHSLTYVHPCIRASTHTVWHFSVSFFTNDQYYYYDIFTVNNLSPQL